MHKSPHQILLRLKIKEDLSKKFSTLLSSTAIFYLVISDTQVSSVFFSIFSREASFVAYEGDDKLYKVNYGDPRNENSDKKLPKSSNSNSKHGTRQSSSKSQKSHASVILAQRRNENLEGKRRKITSKSSSAPPEGRTHGAEKHKSTGKNLKKSQKTKVEFFFDKAFAEIHNSYTYKISWGSK